MLTLEQAEEVLRDRASGLQDRIIRFVGQFTVALFGVFGSQSGARLQLAGTGTLVAVGDSHYILTARHVWERVLKAAQRVGITLKENVDHEFLMYAESIAAVGPEPPGDFTEWGPDIVFLRIPAEHVGTIGAYQTFFNLSRARAIVSRAELQTWVLMGTPSVLGTFTERHANLQICGFFVWGNAERQVRGEFDYIDVGVDASLSEVPADFGGVSGGGLWSVLISRSESAALGIDWSATLQGVAFYQSALVEGRRTIRCHGERSIEAAMPS